MSENEQDKPKINPERMDEFIDFFQKELFPLIQGEDGKGVERLRLIVEEKRKAVEERAAYREQRRKELEEEERRSK